MNTLKFFFALNLFFGFGPTLLAQCDGFDASTFTHTTSVWDWRDFNESNWTAHLKTDIAGQYVTRTLPNPCLRRPFRNQSMIMFWEFSIY